MRIGDENIQIVFQRTGMNRRLCGDFRPDCPVGEVVAF